MEHLGSMEPAQLPCCTCKNLCLLWICEGSCSCDFFSSKTGAPSGSAPLFVPKPVCGWDCSSKIAVTKPPSLPPAPQTRPSLFVDPAWNNLFSVSHSSSRFPMSFPQRLLKDICTSRVSSCWGYEVRIVQKTGTTTKKASGILKLRQELLLVNMGSGDS